MYRSLLASPGGGLVALAFLAAIALPAEGHADSRIDGIEHIFGATNVGAITGHGRLSVAVSPEGDITVVSWPSPSVADQLAYASSNARDARSQPRLGAPEGAGMFLGLLVEHADASREVTWLRDRGSWDIEQTYGPSDGPNPTTVHTSGSLGLTVTVVDAVAPPPSDGSSWHDALVRDVTVERDGASTVESAWLVTYANLSPQPPNAKMPQLPMADWVYDGRNDFAAVWDDSASAVVHFHPNDQRIYDALSDVLTPPEVSFGPAGELLKDADPAAGDVASLAAALDDEYAEGSYLALTTSPAPDQHQVGFDETPFCALAEDLAANILELPERFPTLSLPVPPDVVDVLKCDPDRTTFRERDGWMHTAEDAWSDAADGELSGGSIAAGEVNEALRTPLTFSGHVASAQVVLGAGETADAARAALSSVDPSAVPGDAEAALSDWLSERRLPEEAPARATRVARRSLINVRVGTDAETGMVVASISRQPPYGLDWPRDGAFFNVLLDVSGQHELVSRRNELYAEWQRREPVRPSAFIDPEGSVAPPRPDGTPGRSYPAGAWEMNYYPDGTAGGVFRFEIDNAGFAVWAMVAHVGWVPEGERESYLRSVYDSIELGTDFLAEWRDPENGLQFNAEEDDNPGYVQTIHGAVTTYGAIAIASRAARMLGETEDAERWEHRAGELRDSILAHLYDEEAMRFVRNPGEPFMGDTPTGPTAWLVWPMTLLPLGDARLQEQVVADLDAIRPAVTLEAEGGQYFMKNTVSAGVALLGASGSARDALQSDLDGMLPMVADQATEGTDHFGEAMVVVEEGGERRASQRVANPHLWEGTLFYLTAMAIEDPAALTAYDEVLPESQVPAPGTVGPPLPGEDGGVGDGGTSSDGGGSDATVDLSGDNPDGCGCGVARPSSRAPVALLLVGVLVVGAVLWRRRRK